MLADVLARFLSDASPKVLCLRGPWGVGKTFAWNRALKVAANGDRLSTNRYSYVSLFGLSSIEAVRSSILENFGYLRTDPKAKWLENAGKATKFVPAVGALLGQSELSGIASSLAFGVVKNQIVCFDDLERRGDGLRLEDVFGLASFLHESRGCRVAILLNDDKLIDGKDEYRRYYEKVVDVSVLYSPLPSEIASVAITDSDRISHLLRTECANLGISNIRIVQKILSITREAEPPASKMHPGVLEALAHSVPLLAWSYFEGEGAPTLAYLEKYGGVEFELRDTAKTEQEKVWDEKLGLYGWGVLDDIDRELLRRLERGYFDSNRLLEVLNAKNDDLVTTSRAMKVADAWKKYHDSFEQNEEDVVSSFVSAVDENINDITPSRLDGILHLFRELGRGDLADQVATKYVSSRTGDAKAFDVRELRGYDPLSDAKLVELLGERHRTLVPDRTIDGELAVLADRDGWDEKSLEFLASCQPSDYERVFRAVRGEALADTVRACLQFQNISNADGNMRAIVDHAREALKNIARDSKLNAQRVIKFGVRIDSPGDT